MLVFDGNGILVDTHAGDGGDSANRAGLWALLGNDQPLEIFESGGLAVRHPFQKPWNHPGNFTRDQLLAFVAGAWRKSQESLVRRIFWRHARRGFFAQNFERDEVGTFKKPWPHRFINDRKESQFSWGDFADPLLPDHIWHLILCGRIYPLYFWGLVGYPWLGLSVLVHAKMNKSDDDGQIISQCLRAGRAFVWLYKISKPDWREALRRYWGERRQMSEMADALIQALERNEKLVPTRRIGGRTI